MVRERGRERTRRDGEEHSSQLDGAGRLSMPRSAQARVRVLFLSVLVSLALPFFPYFPSLSLLLSRMHAARLEYASTKHLAGHCFRVYVSSFR